MSPGGHLVTTVAACAVTLASTGSWPLTAAVAAGGFAIDVDHMVDYVFFEGRRDLRPAEFLRYYVEGDVRLAVLILHSYELVALLGALAWATGSVLLCGYLVGALMHLALDVVWNGRLTPRSIGAFYSFTYRAAHRFDSAALLGTPVFAPAGRFWSAFFRGATLAQPPAPAPIEERDAFSLPESRSFANPPS
jgi:hypothetical protein